MPGSQVTDEPEWRDAALSLQLSTDLKHMHDNPRPQPSTAGAQLGGGLLDIRMGGVRPWLLE